MATKNDTTDAFVALSTHDTECQSIPHKEVVRRFRAYGMAVAHDEAGDWTVVAPNLGVKGLRRLLAYVQFAYALQDDGKGNLRDFPVDIEDRLEGDEE